MPGNSHPQMFDEISAMFKSCEYADDWILQSNFPLLSLYRATECDRCGRVNVPQCCALSHVVYGCCGAFGERTRITKQKKETYGVCVRECSAHYRTTS